MPSATLTSEAKETLRKTVRALRSELISELSRVANGKYELAIALDKARLSEADRTRRQRLETWLDEQVRSAAKDASKESAKGASSKKPSAKDARARFFEQAVKEAASTLLNRLIVLLLLEAAGLSRPAVVTAGWQSLGYKEFAEFAPDLCTDETQGYSTLLEMLFDELAAELPGLFGPVGLTALFPIPAATLRSVIQQLNQPELACAWTDDTTLGWVYQFWNDPDRKTLDDKIEQRQKIEPHEIASKTQMFTERYMVEWLLHNSLGQLWLAMCARHGWVPEAKPALDALEARRTEWRQRREAGEVALDALMPIESHLEDRWKYWVPQPLPESAVQTAPETLRQVKLLDPACGSGHFLVVAFDLLAALYQEEARHRGETWSDAQIAELILHENLHGIDIDPRAVQIAAAALWLKAKASAPDAKLRRMNLVAPALRLGALPKDDAALVRLKDELERKVGLPRALTQQLVEGLSGVDHLGSLLKVDRAIDDALKVQERTNGKGGAQGDLFRGMPPEQRELCDERARATVLDRIERFLDAHAAEQDLGLRLEGEQLAAGVRFVRMVREGTYDLVVGNPPYLGTSRLKDNAYLDENYPRGKADLYAAFLERGLELVREHGTSSLLTMRGWMSLVQYDHLRQRMLRESHVQLLGDLGWGAFADMTDNPICMSVISKSALSLPSVAVCPTSPTERVRTDEHHAETIASLLCQTGRHEFDVARFEAIEGAPIVYWWSREFLERYAKAPKLGAEFKVRKGLCTCNDPRYVRKPWEVAPRTVLRLRPHENVAWKRTTFPWMPTVMGSDGLEWIEPLRDVVLWQHCGLQMKVDIEECYGVVSKRVQSERLYMAPGVAFSMIGNGFAARIHRYRSVFGNKGSSVFPEDTAYVTCAMNSSIGRDTLQSLNPGIGFEVGDVNRMALFPISGAKAIAAQIDAAFSVHEAHREPSVEFRSTGASPWRYAQAWAQHAVDRPDGAPLPPYEPQYDPPDPRDFVSFSIGVALGRFDANNKGILHVAPEIALPAGILFVSATEHLTDSLSHRSAARIQAAWTEHGAAITGGRKATLNEWLRNDFFKHHKSKRLYDGRPIYFPLSSENKSFVAFISIHRWADNTLQTLLADHLHPALLKLEGAIRDLNTARASSDKKAKENAEKQYDKTKKLFDELSAFVAAVRQCAEQGPPPVDPKHPREVDAPFIMDLDDGVKVNSAALWPLLEPQWKEPKKWWKELADPNGKEDYDWAHLAARYFPVRVDDKCKTDPSLAVAHGCFWKYYPEKAFTWELRLQDEIRPDFTIDEPRSDEYRQAFLERNAEKAETLREKERQRRVKARKKQGKEHKPESDAHFSLES